MKMKSLINKLFLLGVLSSFVLLYSCGDDEELPAPLAAPSISYSVTPNEAFDLAANTVTVASGEPTTWTFNVDFPAGFNRFSIMNPNAPAGMGTIIDNSPNNLQGGNEDATVTVNADNTSLTVSFGATLTGTGLTLEVLAVDDINQQSTATINVTISSPAAITQTTTLINPPLGDNRVTQTFYSISENRTYSLSQVSDVSDPISENVDFGYFFLEEANLISPSNFVAFTGLTEIYGDMEDGIPSWGSRNQTRMVLTALANTTEIISVADVEAAVASIDFDAAELAVEGLEVGQVYAFRTAAETVGLFTVSTLVPGFGSEPENGVTLDIILAQAQ